MSVQELLRYWPKEDDVTACVKTDAEASNEAVSAAVHQPMTFEVRAVGADGVRAIGTTDERGLLSAFLNERLPEGRVILPIVGDSGVGKSHVVRWLDAQLQRLPDAERRLVIRIPKGMSLKGVLGLILDKTPGKGLEKYRKKLEEAQDAIDPLRAAGQLCEDLAHSLHEMFEQAQQRLIDNPSDRVAREIDAFCRPDYLQAILRNQYLRDSHFVREAGPNAGPVRRLIEHLSESRTPGADDDRKNVFVDDDLRFIDRLDLSLLGPREKKTINDLLRDDRRRGAISLLNEALDGAKQRLLRTEPAVTELFEAVRRDLLVENRELVLLVEDFAVLSGLQRQLLQVVIKEAVRDGRQELCTMRTALAYTSGYPIPETVRTRAGVEYVIPNSPGDEEAILQRIERLVGAYLNAARQGETRLEAAYNKRERRTDASNDWVPRFEAALEPDERATIEAFGQSEDRYEWFPFNRQVIRALAREASGQDGRVVYNPRFVILHVINRVLGRREDFVRGEFPQSGFGTLKLSAQMTNLIEQRVGRADAERYLRVLAYWGGRPDDLEEVEHLPERVFSAFGLDRARLIGSQPRAPRPSQSTPAPKSGPSITTPTPDAAPHQVKQDARGHEFDAILEQWRSGVKMAQGSARDVRKWVATALARAVDWDWFLFRPQKGDRLEDWKESVFVPNAPGNEHRTASTALTFVCEEDDLTSDITSAQITATLAAIYRVSDVHRGSLDYEGADDDLPRYAAFVDARLYRARQWVLARPLHAEWDPIPALVQGLLLGARALGISGADDNRNPVPLLNAMFTPEPEAPSSLSGVPIATPVAPGGLDSFLDKLARCRTSDQRDGHSWRGLLLELTGARQGWSDKVYAVDPLRLKAAIDETKSRWDFTAAVPARVSGAQTFESVKSLLSELRRLSASVDRERGRLVEWRKEMLEWLGVDFDKDEVVRNLRETLDVIKAEGLSGGVNTALVSKHVDDFNKAPVKTSVDAVAALDGSADRGAVLTAIGLHLNPVVLLSSELRTKYDELLQSATHEQQVNTQAIGKDPVGEAATALVNELDRSSTLIGSIQS